MHRANEAHHCNKNSASRSKPQHNQHLNEVEDDDDDLPHPPKKKTHWKTVKAKSTVINSDVLDLDQVSKNKNKSVPQDSDIEEIENLMETLEEELGELSIMVW